MTGITVSRVVNAPVGEVFRAFTDFANAAQHVSGIERVEMLTDGPVGVGTRFKETRIMFKKEATEEMEVTEYEVPERCVLAAHSCGSDYRSEFRFAAEGSGTRVTFLFEARPVSFFAKLFAPLGKLMMGTMVKMIEKDIDDLQAKVERKSVAA
jgi:uncharacterized protein YndB with AHSA1/START domain